MSDLSPCSSCRRHVHVDDPTCPFCGGAVEPARPVRVVRERLSRSALAALSAVSVGVGLAGCPSPRTLYGAPPDPAPTPSTSTSTSTSQSATETVPTQTTTTTPAEKPLYGGPPKP